MAMCCSCGEPLQKFWVAWDVRTRGWQVLAESPDVSRTDPIYAATLNEAAFAVHHDPAVLIHDVVSPPRTHAGWRAPGRDHDPPRLPLPERDRFEQNGDSRVVDMPAAS